MIKNIRDLADTIGCSPRRIRKELFRATECGVTFDETDNGITIAGFAEGSQGECVAHKLDYPFEPFTFWDTVALADGEGNDAWHEANDCEYCGQAGCNDSCDESQAGGF